jgi:hypothetical protein
MTFTREVKLPCGCISRLVGGMYHDEHTCSQHQAELQQSKDESQRRLQAPLQGDRSFRLLR